MTNTQYLIKDTHKLFWKQWPIKAIISISADRDESRSQKYSNYFSSIEQRRERQQRLNEIVQIVKRELPNAGFRREDNVSVFVNNEEELDQLVDMFGSRIIQVRKPKNETATKLLFEHTTDVIRDRPWYGRFGLRARILYTNHFKTYEINNFKAAVNSLDKDKWHAAGLLWNIISFRTSFPAAAPPPAWGQPMYLYLLDGEDAALLKLQIGTVIERFERIRSS